MSVSFFVHNAPAFFQAQRAMQDSKGLGNKVAYLANRTFTLFIYPIKIGATSFYTKASIVVVRIKGFIKTHRLKLLTLSLFSAGLVSLWYYFPNLLNQSVAEVAKREFTRRVEENVPGLLQRYGGMVFTFVLGTVFTSIWNSSKEKEILKAFKGEIHHTSSNKELFEKNHSMVASCLAFISESFRLRGFSQIVEKTGELKNEVFQDLSEELTIEEIFQRFFRSSEKLPDLEFSNETITVNAGDERLESVIKRYLNENRKGDFTECCFAIISNSGKAFALYASRKADNELEHGDDEYKYVLYAFGDKQTYLIQSQDLDKRFFDTGSFSIFPIKKKDGYVYVDDSDAASEGSGILVEMNELRRDSGDSVDFSGSDTSII